MRIAEREREKSTASVAVAVTEVSGVEQSKAEQRFARKDGRLTVTGRDENE